MKSMTYRGGILGLSISVLLLSTSPIEVNADPLADILETGQVKRMAKKDSAKRLNDAKWLTPGSNFSAVFRGKDGPLRILDWLKIDTSGFIPGNPSNRSTRECAVMVQEFSNEQLQKIVLTVMVPHPKFAETLDAGLLPPYSSLVPPSLRASNIAAVTVKGVPGTLYETDNGDCSLMLRGARHSAIHLATDNCSAKDSMMTLADRLDLTAFDAFLES